MTRPPEGRVPGRPGAPGQAPRPPVRGGAPPGAPPPELVALLPAHRFGPQVGRGAFGQVFTAHNLTLDREEAVKSLAPRWLADREVIDRFVDEGRLVARLEHPHVVRVFQAVRSGSACALVMEWLPGGTLTGRFRSGLTPPESCAVVLAVLTALDAAHQAGVLHRDVKPDNVLFGADGTPKVVDFGIAQILGGVETLATPDGQGVAGTPQYMAPEQARGETTLGPPTDVYACGVMLFELLTGDLPHSRGTGALDLLHRRSTERARPVPPEVPAPLAAVVRRALAFHPRERYPSAEEFARELARAGTEVFGPNWHQETAVVVRPSPAVGRELARAADRAAAASTMRISMARVLPRLPAQSGPPPTSAPGMGGRGAGPRRADAATGPPVPVRRLTAVPQVRRWPAVVAAVLVAAGLLVAALAPGLGRGGATAGAPVAVGTGDRVDLSDPVALSGTAPASAGAGQTALARLSVSAAGVPLGQGDSAPVTLRPGQRWSTAVTLRSWTRWVAGGAVDATVDLVATGGGAGDRVLASSEVTIRPEQKPYTTVMGWGSLLLVLFAVASAAEVLRGLRRRGGLGPVQLLVPGVLLGAGAWVALAAYTAHVPSVVTGALCVVLVTAGLIVAGVAATPRGPARGPARAGARGPEAG